MSGNATLNNAATCSSTLNVSGITTLKNKTIVKGILNVHKGVPYADNNQALKYGRLVIGDTL